MDYKEYESLKVKIKADYQKKKDALELVWGMSQKREGFNCSLTNQSMDNMTDVLRKIIDSFQGEFTSKDIHHVLIRQNINVARGFITNTLHRLKKQKEIIVIKKGIGQIGSLFKCSKIKGFPRNQGPLEVKNDGK